MEKFYAPYSGDGSRTKSRNRLSPERQGRLALPFYVFYVELQFNLFCLNPVNLFCAFLGDKKPVLGEGGKGEQAVISTINLLGDGPGVL